MQPTIYKEKKCWDIKMRNVETIQLFLKKKKSCADSHKRVVKNEPHGEVVTV